MKTNFNPYRTDVPEHAAYDSGFDAFFAYGHTCYPPYEDESLAEAFRIGFDNGVWAKKHQTWKSEVEEILNDDERHL